jgi:hypothetical protein
MPTSYMAHWQSICQRRQAITDRDNLRKNDSAGLDISDPFLLD